MLLALDNLGALCYYTIKPIVSVVTSLIGLNTMLCVDYSL